MGGRTLPARRADIPPRRARVWLAILLLAGLTLRIAVTLSVPMGLNGFSDDNAYLNAAAVFSKTGYVTYAQPGQQSGVLGIGMPLLLGGLFALFGYQPAGLVLSHIGFAAIGLLTAGGVYWLGAMLHSRRAGLAGAALTALELGLVATNSLFYTETPYMCLNLFAFACALRCAREWHFPSFWIGTACLCGAAAFKGLAVLAPVCVLPLLWVRKVPLRRWLPKAALAALAVAMVFLPWCVRNLDVVGVFTPFPISQGDQKLLGTYEGLGCPAGTYEEDIAALDREAWAQGYQADVYRRLARRGELAEERLVRWIRENPVGFVVTHTVYKPLMLLGMSFYPQPLWGVSTRVVQAGWWALLALAAYGLAAVRRTPHGTGLGLPALYLALAALLTALYVPLARYNAPHVPFVLFYAGLGLCNLWARRGVGLGTVGQPDKA